jgi:hypothetical protein
MPRVVEHILSIASPILRGPQQCRMRVGGKATYEDWGSAMARFFPNVERVTQARERFAEARYSELQQLISANSLAWPHADDLLGMLQEFDELAGDLELAFEDDGFIVLVPVRAHGAVLTTPVLVDLQRLELSFTSHPTFGAGVIPDTVLAENTDLAADIRESLLGVLATWRNHPEFETEIA